MPPTDPMRRENETVAALLSPGDNASGHRQGLAFEGEGQELSDRWPGLGELSTHLLASSLFISSMRPPPPPPLLARFESDLEVPLGLEPPDASSG